MLFDHGEYARYDTMFVKTDAGLNSMPGMAIGRACLFFSLKFRGKEYSYALVHWLVPFDELDKDTAILGCGWFSQNSRATDVALYPLFPLTVSQGQHLFPVYGSSFLPKDFHFANSLDVFMAYFVNSYINHHSNKFLK